MPPSTCYACRKADAAVPCPDCKVARYCSAACLAHGRDLFQHGRICSLLQGVTPMGGLIVYVGNNRSIDSDNSPSYVALKEFMTAHVPYLMFAPPLDEKQDAFVPDPVRMPLYEQIFTALKAFITTELGAATANMNYGAVEYFEDLQTELFSADWIPHGVLAPGFAYTHANVDKTRPDAFKYTHLLEQIWYTLPYFVKSDKSLSFLLRVRAKRKREEPQLDIASRELGMQASKRQRLAMDTRARNKNRHRLFELPHDLYINVIAHFLSARDAIRLTLATNTVLRAAALPIMEQYLIDRDFNEPVLAMQRAMTPAQRTTMEHIMSTLVPAVRANETVVYKGVALSQRISGIQWVLANMYDANEARVDFDVMTLEQFMHAVKESNSFYAEHCQSVLYGFDIPALRLYYARVACVMVTPMWRGKGTIYFMGANGLRFHLGPDKELSNAYQFVLDYAALTEDAAFWTVHFDSVNPRVLRLTQRSLEYFYELYAFIAWVLAGPDPLLTAYYVLSDFNETREQSIRVQVPQALPGFLDQQKTIKREYHAINLAESSLRYGLRYRVSYDPSLPTVTSYLSVGPPRQILLHGEEPHTVGCFLFKPPVFAE